MVANVDMVGRQRPLELGRYDRQKEEEFWIRLCRSHGKTSYHRRFAWEECIDWVVIEVRSAVVGSLGFSYTVEDCHSGHLDGSLRASEEEMLRMIQLVSQGLQDVSLASCLNGVSNRYQPKCVVSTYGSCAGQYGSEFSYVQQGRRS